MKYSLLVTIVVTLPAAFEGLHSYINEVAHATKPGCSGQYGITPSCIIICVKPWWEQVGNISIPASNKGKKMLLE